MPQQPQSAKTVPTEAMGERKQTPGNMLLISGPSGCGKSTICRHLRQDERVMFSVSATTRPKREGEVHGKDYYFLTTEEFKAKQRAGEFIESADVYGNLYGTLRQPMQEAIDQGYIYLVEIDVQGAMQMRAGQEPGIYVFIAPPSIEALEARLIGRGSETKESLKRRLSKARSEMDYQERYDYVVVNEDLEQAIRDVRKIAGLEKP